MFYTSTLAPSYRDELEELLYFNQRQHRAQNDIVTAIETYGQPSIVEQEGTLRIRLDGEFEPQTLFVLESEQPGADIAGILIYVRETTDNVTLVYHAVRPDYSSEGRHAGRMLAVEMLEKLRGILSVVTGVRTLTVFYNNRRYRLRIDKK